MKSTWNSDCAKPKRPPEASRATREASGWKVEEPMPIRPAASSSMAKLPAVASRATPPSVTHIPAGSRKGIGRRSVYRPIQGCSSEAVHWKVSVIRPIWVKLSANSSLSNG